MQENARENITLANSRCSPTGLANARCTSTSAWWLQMSWHQTGARTSITVMLIWLLQQRNIGIPHSMHISLQSLSKHCSSEIGGSVTCWFLYLGRVRLLTVKMLYVSSSKWRPFCSELLRTFHVKSNVNQQRFSTKIFKPDIWLAGGSAASQSEARLENSR